MAKKLATNPPCRDVSEADGARSYVDFPVFSPYPSDRSPRRKAQPQRAKTDATPVRIARNRRITLSGLVSDRSDAKRRVQNSATVSLGCRVPPSPSNHDQAQALTIPDRKSKRLSFPFSTVSQPSVSNIAEEASFRHHHSESSRHQCKEEVSSSYTTTMSAKHPYHHQIHRDKASASEIYNSSKFAYGSPPSYNRTSYNDFVYGSPPPSIGNHLRQKSREEDVDNGFRSSPLYNDDHLSDQTRKGVMERSLYNDGHWRNQNRKEEFETSLYNDGYQRNQTRKGDVEIPLYNNDNGSQIGKEDMDNLMYNGSHLSNQTGKEDMDNLMYNQTGKEDMDNLMYNGSHLSNQTGKEDMATPRYNDDHLRDWTAKENVQDGCGSREYVQDGSTSPLSYNHAYWEGDVHRSMTGSNQKSPSSFGLRANKHSKSVLDVHNIAKQMDLKESHFQKVSSKVSRSIQDVHNRAKQIDSKESHVRRAVDKELNQSAQNVHNLSLDLKQVDIKELHTQRAQLECGPNEHNRSVQYVHNLAKQMDLKESHIPRRSSELAAIEGNPSVQNVHNLSTGVKKMDVKELHFRGVKAINQSVQYAHNLSTDVKKLDLKETYFQRDNGLRQSAHDLHNVSTDLKQMDKKESHIQRESFGVAMDELNISRNFEQEYECTEFVESGKRSSAANELNRSIEQADEPTGFVEFGWRTNKNPIFPWERRHQEYSLRKTTCHSFISPTIGHGEESMHHEKTVFDTYPEEFYEHDIDFGASVSMTYSSELLNVSADCSSCGSTGTSELSAILQNYCDNHAEAKGRTEEERLKEQAVNQSSSGLRESAESKYFSAESQVLNCTKNSKEKKCKKAKGSDTEALGSAIEKSLLTQKGKGNMDSESLFHEAIRTARAFLRLLSVSVMEASNNEYNQLFQVAGKPDTIFAHLHHMKYGAQALINKLIFQEFDESSYSGTNRNVDQSILLNEFKRISMTSSIDAIGPSNEHYDAWFHRFCNWKLLLMEKNMPWLISWRYYLLETFLEAMKHVWKSHLLAQSSHGVISLYEVKERTRFHGVIMEVVDPDHDDTFFLPEVQLLVNPGFHLQYSTIKAQVYLLPKIVNFDSHIVIKHRD